MKIIPGQTAFITGAASGIGLEISRLLSRRGLIVAMADKNRATLEQSVQTVVDSGGRAELVELDVADADQYRVAAKDFVNRYGGPDLLFNNAGLLGPRGHVQDLKSGQWRQLFDINFFGIIHGLEYFLSAMIERGAPAHVVNTASIAGHRKFKALLPVATYATSKYAVVGLSETLQHDLANTDIGVSVLCPGVVGTNIFSDEPVSTTGIKVVQNAGERVMSAEEAAEIAVKGIESGRFYIFTHPETQAQVQARHESILADFEALGTKG